MSAIIYTAPTEVKLPPTVFQDYENWEKNEKDYIKRLKAHINKQGYKGKNVGEIIRFGVADGYAQYMVLQMRPLGLIHLDLMDGYEFQYAHLMTAKEVNQQIESQKRMDKLFSKKK